MADRVNDEDLSLLDELGVDRTPEKSGGRTPRQQRITAGFEDIERFFVEHGRIPQHGDDRDIFERIYAVRLERIRASTECVELLGPLDKHGLLSATPSETAVTGDLSDAELLSALGVSATPTSDLTDLKHVRSNFERKAAEEVAQRTPCVDFDQYRASFERVQNQIDSGLRQTVAFQHNGKLEPGDWFILDGQKVLIADVAGEWVTKDFGREDRRLRVIFDNGTESKLLHRSLQRALYKSDRNRRILPLEATPGGLFSGDLTDDDVGSGFLYVARSKSTHPFVAQNRDVIHKIGVTGGDVNARVAGAKKDPTFLLADAEIVAVYRLANADRKAMEALLHRFLGTARLDVELKDRFGENVEPREWFLVSRAVIDEIVERIKDGSICDFRYDAKSATLVKLG
jgi:hypothetical protein